MQFKYCAECGHKVEDIKLGDDDCKICPSCKRIYGRNPLPVVEVLVVNEYNDILLKQNYISEDKWTVVSGYMVEGETIEEDHCGYDGINLLNASDESAGQSVPHFHIHIIPRKRDDGIDAWPKFEGAKEDIQAVFDKVRVVLLSDIFNYRF